MKYGEYSYGIEITAPEKIGRPHSASTKVRYLNSLRTFFRDIQEWEWIKRQFDPRRSFAVPRDLDAD
jgi:hypothetical protein